MSWIVLVTMLLTTMPMIQSQLILDETRTINIGVDTGAGPDAGVDTGAGSVVGAGVRPGFGAGVGPDPRVGPGRRAGLDIFDLTGAIPAATARRQGVVAGTGRVDTGTPDLINDGSAAPILTPEQRSLNARCAVKCKTELCYLADADDCRNFITCEQNAKLHYHATPQPCAFGTYWAGLQLQKKITCDIPDNVHCNIDYCRGMLPGARYDHPDMNCKTFWECDKLLQPQPKCCPEGYEFDNRRLECVVDVRGRCHDACPIKIDACLVAGTKTEFFNDNNCVTYWDCEDRNPHPVCCPEGQGYDHVRGCIDAPNCRDACPPSYKPDVCLKPGVAVYTLIDGHCRTHMKCDAVEGDERWCCPSNFVFDASRQKDPCIPRTADMDIKCDDTCPQYYNDVCFLQSVPNDPLSYYENIHGVQMKRPCAPGSAFDVSVCNCAQTLKDAPDNSCNKELDIMFDAPMWHRAGSQSQIEIINIGTIEEGPKLNGKTSFKFNGDLYFRAPFFQSQYDNLYIKIVYLPETGATTGKQVLLSNCMNLDLGAPSMELSLQDNRLVLDLVTDAILSNTTQNLPIVHGVAAVPYTPGIWNTFTAIYNGQDVFLLNEGQGAPTFDRQSLQGPISVAAEGLDIGGCAVNRHLGEGYLGSLAQLQFSKCLNQRWVDIFNKNVP